MKNIDYLKTFLKKHNLKGKMKIKYEHQTALDEYMSDITFEDGLVIHISDVIFDIESDLETNVAEQWMKVKKDRNIGLLDWMKTSPNYMPDDIDKSSIKEFQAEMEEAFNEAKESIDKIFKLEEDDESEDE